MRKLYVPYTHQSNKSYQKTMVFATIQCKVQTFPLFPYCFSYLSKLLFVLLFYIYLHVFTYQKKENTMKYYRKLSLFLLVTLVIFYCIQDLNVTALSSEQNSKNTLGSASAFSIYTLQDFTQKNNVTQGRVAVGGNANISNFTIGSNLPHSASRADLLLNSSYYLNDVYFQKGIAATTKNAKKQEYNQVYFNGAGITNDQRNELMENPAASNLVDFTQTNSYLKHLSKQIHNLASNSTDISMQYSTLTFTGKNKDYNVFTLDLERIPVYDWNHNLIYYGSIDAANHFIFDVPSSSTVLVNVMGNSISFPRMEVTNFHASKILWNFPDASSLELGGSLTGSVLAPMADVTVLYGVSGNLSGNLIAGSYTSLTTSGFVTVITDNAGNSVLFDGFVPHETETVTPSLKPSSEPSSMPTITPSNEPSMEPTAAPSAKPSVVPTTTPILKPSPSVSTPSTIEPSPDPSTIPSSNPEVVPTSIPSINPDTSFLPTNQPETGSSDLPTNIPDSITSSTPSKSETPLVKSETAATSEAASMDSTKISTSTPVDKQEHGNSNAFIMEFQTNETKHHNSAEKHRNTDSQSASNDTIASAGSSNPAFYLLFYLLLMASITIVYRKMKERKN